MRRVNARLGPATDTICHANQHGMIRLARHHQRIFTSVATFEQRLPPSAQLAVWVNAPLEGRR